MSEKIWTPEDYVKNSTHEELTQIVGHPYQYHLELRIIVLEIYVQCSTC